MPQRLKDTKHQKENQEFFIRGRKESQLWMSYYYKSANYKDACR